MGLPNIGPLELIIILAIALLVVGPGRLPEMGNAIGRTIREFRKASSDMTDAVSVGTDPESSTPAQVTPATSTPAESAPAAAPGEPQPDTSGDAAQPDTSTRSTTPEPKTDGTADA